MKKKTTATKNKKQARVHQSSFVPAVNSKWSAGYVRRMFFERHPAHQKRMLKRKHGDPLPADMERDFAWYLNGLFLDGLINEEDCCNIGIQRIHGPKAA